MADKKKTMNQSVFEHLAKRFSECRKEIKRDKVMFASDTPDVMFTAGKALFNAISSNKIDLGDIPDWFTIEPDGIRIDRNGNDRVYLTWDWYWLCAIKWLAKNKPDSGITFSVYLHGVNPEDSLHSGYDVTDYLMGLFRLSDEHLKRTWRQLARASEDACLYLARKAIKEPAEIEQNATPAKPERERWLWKLYEKTLKVIVDAVLGKVWHP